MSDKARRQETIEYINGEPIARLDGVPDAGGWVKAHRDLLRDARLDATAKVIYLLILDECGRTGQHTVQYPYGRIEQEVLISRNTIRKKLIQLQDAGFLEVSGDEGRASGPNVGTRRPLRKRSPSTGESRRVTPITPGCWRKARRGFQVFNAIGGTHTVRTALTQILREG